MVITWLGRPKGIRGLELHAEDNTYSMIDDGVFAHGGMPRVEDSGDEVNGGSFVRGDLEKFDPHKGLETFGFTEQTLRPIVLFNWERVRGWPHAEPWLRKAMDAVRERRSDTTIYLYDPADHFMWNHLVDGYMVSCNGYLSHRPLAWQIETRARGMGLEKVMPMLHPLTEPGWKESMWRFRATHPEITNMALWGVVKNEGDDRVMVDAKRYWEDLLAL